MTLIANVFAKLQTPKNMIRYMSKTSHFRRPFDKQHGKRAQTLSIWTTAPLPNLLITVKVIEMEKVSFSAMQNLKTVC